MQRPKRQVAQHNVAEQFIHPQRADEDHLRAERRVHLHAENHHGIPSHSPRPLQPPENPRRNESEQRKHAQRRGNRQEKDGDENRGERSETRASALRHHEKKLRAGRQLLFVLQRLLLHEQRKFRRHQVQRSQKAEGESGAGGPQQP